jgi:hypothetical protein
MTLNSFFGLILMKEYEDDDLKKEFINIFSILDSTKNLWSIWTHLHLKNRAKIIRAIRTYIRD